MSAARVGAARMDLVIEEVSARVNARADRRMALEAATARHIAEAIDGLEDALDAFARIDTWAGEQIVGLRKYVTRLDDLVPKFVAAYESFGRAYPERVDGQIGTVLRRMVPLIKAFRERTFDAYVAHIELLDAEIAASGDPARIEAAALARGRSYTRGMTAEEIGSLSRPAFEVSAEDVARWLETGEGVVWPADWSLRNDLVRRSRAPRCRSSRLVDERR